MKRIGFVMVSVSAHESGWGRTRGRIVTHPPNLALFFWEMPLNHFAPLDYVRQDVGSTNFVQ